MIQHLDGLYPGDSVGGGITKPLSLDLYTYVENNPLIYSDYSGHIVEIVFDVASLAYDTY